MWCPLSLRERARVRGNETPPTKTAGRTLQAQLDRLPESELTITWSPKPFESGSARTQGRPVPDCRTVETSSPHPGPLPWGEGESPAVAWRVGRARSCGCLGLEPRRHGASNRDNNHLWQEAKGSGARPPRSSCGKAKPSTIRGPPLCKGKSCQSLTRWQVRGAI